MLVGIGNKIRKCRILKGFSQEYVAMRLGISQNAYSKYEAGLTKIDSAKLNRIAAAIEVSPASLTQFNEDHFLNENIKASVVALDKIQELYERIIKHKDDEIKRLHAEILEIKSHQ